MSTGVLNFEVKDCAEAFFYGSMEYLEDVDCNNCLKKMRIVIFDQNEDAK